MINKGMGMIFFDKVSKVASAVGEDDSFFGSSDTEKNIARKILRNRGY